MAASEFATQPAHLPPLHYRGPWTYAGELDRPLQPIIQRFSNSQQQSKNPEPCFRWKAGDPVRCPGPSETRPDTDEASMSEGVSKSSPPAKSPTESKSQGSAAVQARTLPPIQNAAPIPASQDVFQRAPTAPSPVARPQQSFSTPPDQRSSRPIGVLNLLNPTGLESAAAVHTQRGPGNYSESPPTPSSLGPTSRGATPAVSTTSGQTRSPIDASISHITPPSISAVPVLGAPRAHTPRSPTTWLQNTITKGLPTGTIDARQSPFLLPRDETITSNGPNSQIPPETSQQGHPMPPRTYAPPLPRMPSPQRQSSQESSYSNWQGFDRSGSGLGQPGSTAQPEANPSTYPYNQINQPEQPSSLPGASTGQPQSFFTNPFSASGQVSGLSQSGMNRNKGFELPTSSTTAQSQYQIMTLETEQGPIQVPVDVQAASKVADEKRKRNATASHRFRQRRKEKERETSENIAKLESQVREMTEEKEHYQKERDFFQDFILRHRIPLPPRPPSPRRRRHATMSGSSMSSYQDSENEERGGRQTRRRTSAYAPPTGSVPMTNEPPPPLPNFERISAMPSEHIQPGNRLRPHNTYPSTTNGPYSQPPPR